MSDDAAVPRIRQVVLDTPRVRELAEFYREMFGLAYRPGDEPPPTGEPDPNGEDWLVLRNDDGVPLAFSRSDGTPRSTWPSDEHPQMLHLDTTVPTAEALQAQRERALALGATELFDRTDDPDEPLVVFADPSGHPFCVFVSAS